MFAAFTMQSPDARRPARRLQRAVALCLAAACCWSAHGKEVDRSLRFEQVFSDKGEPAALHYTADYVSRGATHRMEAWRDGGRRLKRRADDAVEIYVSRTPGDPEFRMTTLDLKRKILTQIDRTNLYRIGDFTDWFDLAHGLKHPRGEYRLVKTHAVADAPAPLEPCAWYDLTQGERTIHVCWGQQSRLPMLMLDPGGQVLWRITRVERKPIPAKTFDVHDEGFVHNDANHDIEND